MTNLDGERQKAENFAKQVQFENSTPQAPRRAGPMTIDKSWAASHFSGYSADAKTLPTRKPQERNSPLISLPVKISILLALVAGAGFYADHLGLIHFRIFHHDQGNRPQESDGPTVIPIVQTSGPVYRPPAPIPGGSGPLPDPAPAEKASSSKDQDQEITEHIKHLENGFELMQREMDETKSKESDWQWELTIRRDYHNLSPWSAAERLDDIQMHADRYSSYPLNIRRQIDDNYNQANADYINAQRGVADCQAKENSLHERMVKCAQEHDALVTGNGDGQSP